MNTLTKEQILDYLRKHKGFLEAEFGVTRIALFGSFARDEAHAGSDIDLLVDMKEEDFKIRFALKTFLEHEFHRKVDVGYFDGLRLFIRECVEEDLIYA